MSSFSKKLDSNTVWFVTGCSSGLGRSFATVIHKAGHRIVATARNIESLSFLPDAPSVLKLKLDVTSLKDIEKSVNDAVEAFGRIDILINNAGYGLMGDTEAVPEADARLQLETNFWGPVHITRAILPIFREINAPNIGGTIVQISSMGGWLSFPGGAFYHSSKWALEGFTESVAKELHPEWNIQFLIVEPGAVRTNFAGPSLKFMPRHPAYDIPSTPLSQLIQYMMSPESQNSWSDPDDCARLLFDVVVGQNDRALPTRLLMGEDTVSLIKADIEKNMDEIKAWETESRGVSAGGEAQLGNLGV